MGFLGIEFKGVKEKRSKFASNVLWPWQYDRDLPHDANMYVLVNEYRGWVYTCSGLNSTTVASAPLRLYAALPNKKQKIKAFKTKDVGSQKENYFQSNSSLIQKAAVRKAERIVEVLEHPVLDLFNSVNGFMNKFSLFELTELYQELTGNAFWYVVKDKIGKPQEIWVMPPQNTKIIPDRVNFIKGYEYQIGSKNISYREDEVVHFKFPSPTNLYYGYSPLSSISSEQNIYNSMNRYENSLFKNMGRLDGAFETEHSLSDHEFERLKVEIKENFVGVENQGKSPLLDNGISFKPYSWAPKELAYINGRTKIKETILAAFGHTPGMYEASATQANAIAARALFITNTITPRLRRMEEKINEKIMPLYDDKLFVAFDNIIPEDKEFRLQEIRTFLDTGYSTVNIERQNDLKDPLPFKYADEGFKQVNMAPAEMLLEGSVGAAVGTDALSEANKRIEYLNYMMKRFEERTSDN